MSTHYETNLVHPYLSKVSQQYQKHNKRHHGFGKFEYDKQNKTKQITLTAYIDWNCDKFVGPIYIHYYMHSHTCKVIKLPTCK
jgi:hypothetical protein